MKKHLTEAIASKIVAALAAERRRVVGRWRLEVIYRRIAFEENLKPPDPRQVSRLVALLWKRGFLVPFPDSELREIYRIDDPYARMLPASEEQAVQEAHPWAVFSHLTALVLHGLTDEIPHTLYVTDFGSSRDRLPLGTRREDWVDLPLPTPMRPWNIGDVNVQWMKSRLEFGVGVIHDQPVPLYVTEVERSLCDALRKPDKCNGIETVLGAWGRARDSLNLKKLVDCVERFESGVLRQRVGFLLEWMGLEHSRLADWQARAQRGGSMKLVADKPYASTYSERWCLSLNVPSGLLEELQQA